MRYMKILHRQVRKQRVDDAVEDADARRDRVRIKQ